MIGAIGMGDAKQPLGMRSVLEFIDRQVTPASVDLAFLFLSRRFLPLRHVSDVRGGVKPRRRPVFKVVGHTK